MNERIMADVIEVYELFRREFSIAYSIEMTAWALHVSEAEVREVLGFEEVRMAA